MKKWISIYFPLIAILGFGSHSQAQTTPGCLIDGSYFLEITGTKDDPGSITGDADTSHGRESINWWVSKTRIDGQFNVTGYISTSAIHLTLKYDSNDPGIAYLTGPLGSHIISWTAYHGHFQGFEVCF